MVALDSYRIARAQIDTTQTLGVILYAPLSTLKNMHALHSARAYALERRRSNEEFKTLMDLQPLGSTAVSRLLVQGQKIIVSNLKSSRKQSKV